MAWVPSVRAQDNGIYADFTTSLGAFTCRLDYTNAPKTTANFIGLATGASSWLSGSTGLARTNLFHDGLMFHRVIRNFMIQGGSPNGQGTDSPGYVFPDEFTPGFNDVHTIFGRVTSGQDVVTAISQVATGANDKPLTNVTVLSVAVRRVGTAAQAFDIGAQGLPVIVCPPLRPVSGTSGLSLAFSNTLHAENILSTSTDLVHWTSASLGVDLEGPVTNTVSRATIAPAQFHTLSQVQYPASTFAPRTLNNRTLTLAFRTTVSGELSMQFNAAGGGTYTYGASSGTIDAFNWIQKIYRGHLVPIEFSGFPPMTLQLNFSTNGNGSFSGTMYLSPTFTPSVAGTFTLSPP